MKIVARLIIGLLTVAAVYLVVSQSIFEFREDAIVDNDSISPVVPHPIAELAPFRLSWDSEATPNWHVAFVLGKMSELSYDSPVEAEAGFKQLGFTDTHRKIRQLVGGD